MNDKSIDFVNVFADWLREQIVGEETPAGWTALFTPFLDCDNDGLTVYLKQNGDKILISDDCYILSGHRPVFDDASEFDKKQHQKAIHIAKSYGVEVVEEEMRMVTDKEHYPVKLLLFLHAMIAVSDFLAYSD